MTRVIRYTVGGGLFLLVLIIVIVGIGKSFLNGIVVELPPLPPIDAPEWNIGLATVVLVVAGIIFGIAALLGTRHAGDGAKWATRISVTVALGVIFFFAAFGDKASEVYTKLSADLTRSVLEEKQPKIAPVRRTDSMRQPGHFVIDLVPGEYKIVKLPYRQCILAWSEDPDEDAFRTWVRGGVGQDTWFSWEKYLKMKREGTLPFKNFEFIRFTPTENRITKVYYEFRMAGQCV